MPLSLLFDADGHNEGGLSGGPTRAAAQRRGLRCCGALGIAPPRSPADQGSGGGGLPPGPAGGVGLLLRPPQAAERELHQNGTTGGGRSPREQSARKRARGKGSAPGGRRQHAGKKEEGPPNDDGESQRRRGPAGGCGGARKAATARPEEPALRRSSHVEGRHVGQSPGSATTAQTRRWLPLLPRARSVFRSTSSPPEPRSPLLSPFPGRGSAASLCVRSGLSCVPRLERPASTAAANCAPLPPRHLSLAREIAKSRGEGLRH